MDTTARILLHVFTAAAAGFIHFVNGKWGQASREVLAWNDYCGFRRIGTSPLGPRLSSSTKEDAQQLLRHRVSGVTTADSRDSSVGVGPRSQLFIFFWTSVFRFLLLLLLRGYSLSPDLLRSLGILPLSDTNYLRLLAAAAANAMVTTVDGGEHS